MAHETVEKQLVKFLKVAERTLAKPSPRTSREKLRLVHQSGGTLAERVAELEETEEFRSLCQGVKSHLNGIGYGSGGWDQSIGNWFLHSGTYHVADR